MAVEYAVLFVALVAAPAHGLLTTWRQRSAMTAVAETRNPFTSGLLTLFVVTFIPYLGAALSGAAALLVLLGTLVAPLLVWPFPVAPFNFGYLQARLNKTWAKQGTPMVAASQF